MLAPLAGRIYDHAPQQHPFPLDDSDASLHHRVLITDDIVAAWNRWHPGVEPLGFLLRDAYPDRWLRIHSLPEAKRYATSGFEHAELRRRHRAAAADALGETEANALLLVDAVDGGSIRDLAKRLDLAESAFPHLWALPSELSDPDEGVFVSPMAVFGFARQLSEREFNAFLGEVAEDRCRGLLFSLGSGQVYAPYDGGADLIYSSELARDTAARRLASWVSPREDGL